MLLSYWGFTFSFKLFTQCFCLPWFGSCLAYDLEMLPGQKAFAVQWKISSPIFPSLRLMVDFPNKEYLVFPIIIHSLNHWHCLKMISFLLPCLCFSSEIWALWKLGLIFFCFCISSPYTQTQQVLSRWLNKEQPWTVIKVSREEEDLKCIASLAPEKSKQCPVKSASWSFCSSFTFNCQTWKEPISNLWCF